MKMTHVKLVIENVHRSDENPSLFSMLDLNARSGMKKATAAWITPVNHQTAKLNRVKI
jgi:hypothetical protein